MGNSKLYQELERLAGDTEPKLDLDTTKIRMRDQKRIRATSLMLARAVSRGQGNAMLKSLNHNYLKLVRDVGEFKMEVASDDHPKNWELWFATRYEYIDKMIPMIAAIGLRDNTVVAAMAHVRVLQNERHALRLARRYEVGQKD